MHHGLENYNVTLAKELLGEDIVAHNAVEDCKMLIKLVMKTGQENVLSESFFVQQMTIHGVEAKPDTVAWLCLFVCLFGS